MKICYSLILTFLVNGIIFSQSNKILHLDLNAGIILGNYGYPNLEAGISMDLPFITAKLSHSKNFDSFGNDRYYWRNFGQGEGVAIAYSKFKRNLEYTNLSLFSNLDLLGYDVFLGPGIYYRHKLVPRDYHNNHGLGLSIVGGYRFQNFNLTASILVPFYEGNTSSNLKLGYRIGFMNLKKGFHKRIKITRGKQGNKIKQNRIRLEVGAGFLKAASSRFTGLTIKPYYSLQYYLKNKAKLYFMSNRRSGMLSSDDFPYVELSFDFTDRKVVENLNLLAFQANYHLGYNLILNRNEVKDLDFELGGGAFVTTSYLKEFVKENWNVDTNSFGVFANAQYRFKIFATGINCNIPLYNRLPVNFNIYTAIGINYKDGSFFKKLFKRKKSKEN